MALIAYRKSNGGGFRNIILGTTEIGNPSTEGYRIVEAWLDQAKFNGLSGGIKGAIITAGRTILELINAPFGISSLGNTDIIKRPIDGSGWFECIISSNVTTEPQAGKVDCNRIRINKAAYDALSVAGKNDINQTLATLFNATEI